MTVAFEPIVGRYFHLDLFGLIEFPDCASPRD